MLTLEVTYFLQCFFFIVINLQSRDNVSLNFGTILLLAYISLIITPLCCMFTISIGIYIKLVLYLLNLYSVEGNLTFL